MTDTRAYPESDVIEISFVHRLTESVARYASASRGIGTHRAYTSQWSQFVAWCERENLDPLSGEPTIALHIAGLADEGYAVSTIDVRLAAIKDAYLRADVPLNLGDATVAPVREGISRTLRAAARRKAAPALPDTLRAMLATRRPSEDAQGARDRALLLVGFGAALRRSELVGLDIGDLVEIPGKGLRVTVRRSKTDQIGEGQTVYVAANPADAAFCPVVAWRRWMQHRSSANDMQIAPALRTERPWLCAVDKAGQLSGERLTDQTVARVIKAAANEAGFEVSAFSGHSLRRGCQTAGAEAGADLKDLMRHARHSDPRVSIGYIEEASAWINNVSAKALGARQA